MSAIPLQRVSAPAVPRAKTIFYIRAVVALGMIGAWAACAATGILVWLAADGRGAGQLQLLFGASKHSWMDIHVVISTLAVALTITHLTVMRRGVLAYARLLLTPGFRSWISREYLWAQTRPGRGWAEAQADAVTGEDDASSV